MSEGNTAGLDFVDAREQEYFARAKLGEDVIQFLNSPVGRYLHGCAKQEIEEYRTELETCNVDSIFGRYILRRKIRRLQVKLEHARSFIRWCAEAIQDGEAAYRELETYREV